MLVAALAGVVLGLYLIIPAVIIVNLIKLFRSLARRRRERRAHWALLNYVDPTVREHQEWMRARRGRVDHG